MLANGYRWTLELLHPAQGPPESFPVGDRIDWEPAEESARWAAVRSGDLTLEQAWSATAAVKPIGSASLGEPYASGFEVSLEMDGIESLGQSFSILYFKGVAEECAVAWVRSGRLSAGARFRYLVSAFPQDEPAFPADRPRAAIRTLPPALTIDERAPGDEPHAAAEIVGPADSSDSRLEVPRAVLRELTEHARSSPEAEVGGFLLGRLLRHPASRDVVTVVTAYLPARAKGTATRLSFTPECWTAANAALALRGSGEVLVGWVHSHIVDALCRGCPEEKRRDCPLASGFFSEADRAVHRVAFPRAYQVALVVNLSLGKATHSCFGWRHGTLTRRGFHIVSDPEIRT